MIREALESRHGAVIRDGLSVLGNRFGPGHGVEGYRKDGSVAVARFDVGEDDEADQREARMLRQREVSNVIEELLARGRSGGDITLKAVFVGIDKLDMRPCAVDRGPLAWPARIGNPACLAGRTFTEATCHAWRNSCV